MSDHAGLTGWLCAAVACGLVASGPPPASAHSHHANAPAHAHDAANVSWPVPPPADPNTTAHSHRSGHDFDRADYDLDGCWVNRTLVDEGDQKPCTECHCFIDETDEARIPTYFLKGAFPADARARIQEAVAAWSAVTSDKATLVTGIEFREVKKEADANVIFEWKDIPDDRCGGVATTVARGKAEVELDSSLTWSFEADPAKIANAATQWHFLSVVLHEFGHVIVQAHVGGGRLMEPTVGEPVRCVNGTQNGEACGSATARTACTDGGGACLGACSTRCRGGTQNAAACRDAAELAACTAGGGTCSGDPPRAFSTLDAGAIEGVRDGYSIPREAPSGRKNFVFRVPGYPDRDLVVEDRDGNGRFDFPQAKTVFRGVMRITADNPLEFTGNTILEADAIVIEEGGQLYGDPATLRTLTLVALSGDFTSRGLFDVHASDDLTIRAVRNAPTAIRLTGRTFLGAGDRLVLAAKQGEIEVAPPAPEVFVRSEDGTEVTPPSDRIDPELQLLVPFTLQGGNRIDIAANGIAGSVVLSRVRVGARRITVSTRASLSSVSPSKRLVVTDRSELTTDPQATGLTGSASDLTLESTGPVLVDGGSVLDSGRNVRVQTLRPQDGLCLTREPRLEGGIVDLRGVRAGTSSDGTEIIVGRLLGSVVVGPCAP